MQSRIGGPLWGWFLAGALLGQGLARPEPWLPEPWQPKVHDWRVEAMPTRELRRLDGLGQKRALAIVRERWAAARGDPPTLTAIPGIGSGTLEQVRSDLEERGRSPAACSEDGDFWLFPPPGLPRGWAK